MSMNHIEQLPETLFQSTKNLVLLHLYGNKLEVLPKSIFKNLNQLEDLDLSANSLLEISSDIFRGVLSLKRLKLQENQLQQLPLGNAFIVLIDCNNRNTAVKSRPKYVYNIYNYDRIIVIVL